MHFDAEAMRFGSARWASAHDLERAGLFGRDGLPIGFHRDRHIFRRLRLNSDGHWLIVGGAGSGKLRDVLGPLLMQLDGQRVVVNDPRGELAAVTLHNFARWKAFAYCFNPCGLHPHILPQHRLNVLDVLRPSDPLLHTNCTFIAEALIPLSGSASGQHFEITARHYVVAFLKVLVEVTGRASLPDLYRVTNAISADPEYLAAILDAMTRSQFDDVRRIGSEIPEKKLDAPREFSGIVSTLHSHLGFMADGMLQAALEEPDFSLADVTDPDRSVSVFLNIPIEYIGVWAPLLRVIFMVTRLYKSQAQDSPRVTLVIDEAGQLGRFEGLIGCFSYGRGMGLRVVAVYQDLAQITRAFDHGAIQSLMGSSQYRLFLGTRDPQTANLVSQMCGNQTLQFDESLVQQAAGRQQREAIQHLIGGGDPFTSAFDFSHYGEAASNRTKMQRPLISADEVLSLPDRNAVAFLSGCEVPPMRIDKLPYWEQRDLNGYWLPNPHHPPAGRVKLHGSFFSRWHEVIVEDTPPALAEYPQFPGAVSYVSGHRPW